MRVPRDEMELAEDIAWVMDMASFLDCPPRLDGRDSEDVLAELAACRNRRTR